MESGPENLPADQLRFSLRGLLALVTGCAVVFGIIAAVGAPMVQVPAGFAVCGLVAWLTIRLIGVRRQPQWDRFLPRSALAAEKVPGGPSEKDFPDSIRATRDPEFEQPEFDRA